MFNLEDELAKWRQGMAAAGLEDPELIRELEEHLREDIAQQVRSGSTVSDAFTRALERLGRPNSLRREFDLIRQTTVGGVLRSHKWRILLCSVAGLLAAFGFQALRPTLFVSEAKLFIRRIPPEPAPAVELTSGAPITNVSPPDAAAMPPVMDRELQLLTSRDLAERVADSIGPKQILRRAGGGDDLTLATNLVGGGLTVVVTQKSSVVRVAFRHPDKEIVQAVVREVVEQYLKMHVARERVAKVPALAAGRISNVSIIQAPSPPGKDTSNSYPPLALIVLVGMLAGVGWAFVLAWRFNHPERPQQGIG